MFEITKTRHTDATGIAIGYAQRIGWKHVQLEGKTQRAVGHWYKTKDEILADHESYLLRAGWLGEPAPEVGGNIINRRHDELQDKVKQLQSELGDVYSIAHRLALDLECLLLAADNPAATKWWIESCSTLQSWRDFVEMARKGQA